MHGFQSDDPFTLHPLSIELSALGKAAPGTDSAGVGAEAGATLRGSDPQRWITDERAQDYQHNLDVAAGRVFRVRREDAEKFVDDLIGASCYVGNVISARGRDARVEVRVLEGMIADTRNGIITAVGHLNDYIAAIETSKGADLATIRVAIEGLHMFARRTDGIAPQVDRVFRRHAAERAEAETPFAIVVNLLREAVRLATVGDITPGMDDGIGWGKWMTDAEDTLARLKHVPESAPPLKPSDFRKSRADFGKSDMADAMAYAFAKPGSVVEFDPKLSLPEAAASLAGTGKFGDPLRLHREHVETAPPQEPSDDEGPLMIACDSEYKRGAKDDEHYWCNRTFVARIDGTIVASLNVQGYDDDAFDVVRCAAAAWEAPHKSWGPHKADDLLAMTVDPRLADRATYLSTRLTQAITRLVEPNRPAEEGFSIVRDVIAHLQEIGKATTFDANRAQYLDLGNGELYVGDAGYWRMLIQQAAADRKQIEAYESGGYVARAMYDEATATLAEVRGMLEKAREDNADCKAYMIEVFHDTLRWLEGKMEKVPEPDYGERIAGARRELNCALAAMGSPATARKHQGMHHAASHLLFGMGWGWRANEGFWQPGLQATKVFCDRAEVEELKVKAARFDRLAGACRIDGQQDYGRVVHVQVTRGSDEANTFVNYAKQPATLAELADQVRSFKA
jgi:hypothetical protein